MILRTFKDKERDFHSALPSRKSWKYILGGGGGGVGDVTHPDIEIRGAPVSTNSTLWVYVWSKNKGGGGAWAPPLDLPLITPNSK